MNNSEYLEQLLRHGSKPNQAVGDAPKYAAQTAIFAAILYDKPANILILIKYGADVNWRSSSGETPFLFAVLSTSYEAALLLYENGADPLIKNNNGYTAIDYIKRFGGNVFLTHAYKKAYRELIRKFKEKGLLNKSDAN